MPLSVPENHQLILPVEIFPEKLVSISILFSVLLSEDENEGEKDVRKKGRQLMGKKGDSIHFHAPKGFATTFWGTGLDLSSLFLFPLKRKQCAPFSTISLSLSPYLTILNASF